MSRYKRWTEEEDDILYSCFSECSKEYMQKRLPDREWANIKYRANYLGLFNCLHDELDITLIIAPSRYVHGIHDSLAKKRWKGVLKLLE